MSDTLEIFGTEYTGVAGIKATDDNDQIKTYIRPQGTKSISANGTGIDVTEYASVDVSVPSGQPNLQTKSVSYTPSETAQSGTVTADSGYDGLDEVNVSVGAISSTYVGSGITRRTETDLEVWDDVVVVPAGYYSEREEKSIGYVSLATPTATKGTVSNHSVSVTPSITQARGYTDGGTKAGTAVSVSASELVSGTLSVTSSGTKDVTNYASASVPSLTLPSGTSSASSGTRKGRIISSTGFDTLYFNIPTGFNDTAQFYQVDPVPLDTLSVTSNGTYDPEDYDCAGFSSVTVNVSGGGTSKNVQVLQSTTRTNSSSLTKVLGDLTVSKTGTYDIYWSGGRSNTSTSYTWGTRLYVDGSGYGTENTTWSNNCQSNHLSNVSLTANQKLSVYARGRSGSYYTFVPMLTIIEA